MGAMLQRGLMPSVTEILAAADLGPDLSMVKPEVLAWASARGTALHKAIELEAKGTLDRDSLHEEIRPALEAYLRFVADSGHEPIASEMELRSRVWGYEGHPDRVGRHRGLEHLALYDWKMTADFAHNYVRYQTAGYKILWNENHPDLPVVQCFGLWLRKDGTYRLIDVSDPEAEQVFLAAVVLWKARRK